MYLAHHSGGHSSTAGVSKALANLCKACRALAPRGEGGLAAIKGHTALGGRTPVNPSGGLESKGHPIGATGLAQTFELVTQLRGEAGMRQVEYAKVAVSENGGGLWGVEEAVCVVSILSR